MYTLLTEVEAMCNSRPLCSVTDDPEDSSYLTPANFLINRTTINLPVRPIKHTDVHPTITRRELNAMLVRQEKTLNQVWKTWKEQYLRSLGICPSTKEPTIKVGDLVMVSDSNQPRCQWKVGRIVKVLDRRDQIVCAVLVRVGSKEHTRPINFLSKLEL